MVQFTSYLSESVLIQAEQYASGLSSENSRNNFRYLLNHFVNHVQKSPEKMSEENVEEYFSYLFIVRQNRNDTINTKFASLLSFFRYLDEQEIEHEMYPSFESILVRVQIQPREMKVKDRNIIPSETVHKFFEYLESEELWVLRLAAELAVRYGMSTSKILALSSSDLFQSDEYYYFRIADKKKSRQRNIGLREETVQLFLKVSSQETTIIFRSQRGGDRLSARRLEHLISEAGKHISEVPITLSKLRNTCIAYLISEGATYDEIEFMTGSPASMLFRYRSYSGRLAETALRYKGIDP